MNPIELWKILRGISQLFLLAGTTEPCDRRLDRVPLETRLTAFGRRDRRVEALPLPSIVLAVMSVWLAAPS